MKKFRIAGSWEMYGTYEIEADSYEDALSKVDKLALPDNGLYVDESFTVDPDGSYEITPPVKHTYVVLLDKSYVRDSQILVKNSESDEAESPVDDENFWQDASLHAYCGTYTANSEDEAISQAAQKFDFCVNGLFALEF